MTRSSFKGPYIPKFIDIVEAKGKFNEVITLNGNNSILPQHADLILRVYAGIRFIQVRVKPIMIGLKLGEFIKSRKRCIFKFKNKKKKK
jgi:ribosomal protein S19